MAKGDRIEVTVEHVDGTSKVHTIIADGMGRVVEFERQKRDGLVIAEVRGRTGVTLRKYEFRADRVISVVEVKK